MLAPAAGRAGLVRVEAACANGKATRITLRNAPAYCRPCDMDVLVDVPTIGKVRAPLMTTQVQEAPR